GANHTCRSVDHGEGPGPPHPAGPPPAVARGPSSSGRRTLRPAPSRRSAGPWRVRRAAPRAAPARGGPASAGGGHFTLHCARTLWHGKPAEEHAAEKVTSKKGGRR